jgi:hypothetical protein
MVNASLISRLSQAVDQIENRLKPNRPWKVVMVRCDRGEDRDAAIDRHLAAHPQDRGAKVVVVHLRKMLGDDDEKLADEGQNCGPPGGPACEEP